MKLTVAKVASIQGEITPPPDKSITHRAYMLAACARSSSQIHHPLQSEDCFRTLECLKTMGLDAVWLDQNTVLLNPAQKWLQPKTPLYCGNSGTTARLLSGLIASRSLDVTLTGDASLMKRPMERIAEPLRLMGAQIPTTSFPFRVIGSQLQGIEYVCPVASAQVKSCVLLAGLRAQGKTWFTEPSTSRDHTERMLSALGIDVQQQVQENGAHRVGVEQAEPWNGFEMQVPGDLSSAAFWMVAATIVPGAKLSLKRVGTNPSRGGIFDILQESGVHFSLEDQSEEAGEPSATISLSYSGLLKPFSICGALVPRLIDEIPVLAVLATQCDGVSEIRDAVELRHKESDRIQKMADGLRLMGAKVETREDGMMIEGPANLKGTSLQAHHDHRIAMSFAIAGLIADGETTIENAETIATSYPDFEKTLESVIVV